jgi:hypothetical protein
MGRSMYSTLGAKRSDVIEDGPGASIFYRKRTAQDMVSHSDLSLFFNATKERLQV